MNGNEYYGAVLPGLQERFGTGAKLFSLDEWQRYRQAKEPQLSFDEMREVIDRAIATLQGLYVHMDLKRTRRGVDPVRLLQMLKERVGVQEKLDSRTFHTRMLAIFKAFGDVHTAYRLPEPYISTVAFLPFIVNAYGDAGNRKYLVTRTLWGALDDETQHGSLKRGVRIIRWNGTPIEGAVARGAESEEGSNVSHDLALGLQFLTVRWLGASFEPDAPWVMVDYEDDKGHEHQSMFWWSVLVQQSGNRLLVAPQAVDAVFGGSRRRQERQRAVHTASQIVHYSRRRLFVKEPRTIVASPADLTTAAEDLRQEFRGYVGRRELSNFTNGVKMTAAVSGSDEVPSLMPLFFDARRHKGKDLLTHGGEDLSREEQEAIAQREFGYIGIRAFPLDEPDRGLFKYEFRRLLNLMPSDGLILDVRDNPGGSANNAEESLQFLTPKPITPLPFRFLASPTTRQLVESPVFDEYKASVVMALGTGGAFSAGLPITPPARANALGQHYFGPVLLVTNSTTYSAADIFAAGFQDNAIGPILGVDETTGAGGANCWFYQFISRVLETPPLPQGINMQFAVRQCLRIGTKTLGVPIEEIGVPSDGASRYSLTEKDILEPKPFGLLLRAARELSKMDSCDLETTVDESSTKRELTVTTKGIDRLDVYVDGRPIKSAIVEPHENQTMFVLPVRDDIHVEIRGFASRRGTVQLVARYVQVFTEVPQPAVSGPSIDLTSVRTKMEGSGVGG